MTTTKAPKTSSTSRRSCVKAALPVSVHYERSRGDGSVIEFTFTEVDDGDFHIDAEPTGLADRRMAVMSGEWAVARQVHGADVVDASTIVAGGLDAHAAPEADAIITDEPGRPIAVQGADCAPLGFVTSKGPVAVAHAGWRGLASGIVDSVVNELAMRGAVVTEVLVGPVIGPGCYEFGSDDLEAVAGELGDVVRAETASGTPALDLRAAIRASCEAAGVEQVSFVRPCTGCSNGGFSHRARKDTERHALAVRIRP